MDGKILLNSQRGDPSKFVVTKNGLETTINRGRRLENRLGLKSGSVGAGNFLEIYILYALGHIFNGLDKDVDENGNAIENVNWRNSQKVVNDCFKKLKKE